MIHSNLGELHQLLSTFSRVWGAGGDASLSLKTVDGKVSAVLEVQLGPPSALRPGAPEAQNQAAGSWTQQPGQHRRRRQRGPGRQGRDAARREAWRMRRQEAQLSLIPPPPPPSSGPPRQLVTVVRERNKRPSFCQLDGEARETKATEPVCYTDCDIPGEHCNHCKLCFELCPEHSGCVCDPSTNIITQAYRNDPSPCALCETPT